MPRPNPRAPRAGQESLFEPERTGDQREGEVLRGRHSEAVDRALRAATDAELHTDVDEAARTAVRSIAWSLDVAEAQNKPYLPSKVIQPLTELLGELHMTPESRQDDTDNALAELMAEMAEVENDADGAAPVHHPEGE